MAPPMEWFFADLDSAVDGVVRLGAAESHHLVRVFRTRTGDIVTLTDGRGTAAEAELIDGDPRGARCAIGAIRRIAPPPCHFLTVALSTIRPNRMDWAIEKLTELGVGAIQPLHCRHTSVTAFKRDHLLKLMHGAVKQSRQAWLPRLADPVPFDDDFATDGPVFLAHLDPESHPLTATALPEAGPATIVIGPEGGFSDSEIALARQRGYRFIALAATVLRTETAAVTAAAQCNLLRS